MSLEIHKGEIFSLLGPNGGGKTTLFRILSTLISPLKGTARIFDYDIKKDAAGVRTQLGVVFQSPSLDRHLSVRENLIHQGHLYGLRGSELKSRMGELLDALSISDRKGDLVKTLSGGLKRRAEIAKAMLHRPHVLLMDEPSTGLDPKARLELWDLIQDLREKFQITVVLTTHIMDEADRSDRIAILHRGKIVSLGTPAQLKGEIKGDVISLSCADPNQMKNEIQKRFSAESVVLNGGVLVEHENGHQFLSQVFEAFPGKIDSVNLRRPTLEDVFTHQTGERFDHI